MGLFPIHICLNNSIVIFCFATIATQRSRPNFQSKSHNSIYFCSSRILTSRTKTSWQRCSISTWQARYSTLRVYPVSRTTYLCLPPGSLTSSSASSTQHSREHSTLSHYPIAGDGCALNITRNVLGCWVFLWF